MDEIRYDDVWQSADEATQDEVLAFWRRSGFDLSADDTEERLSQLVFVARDANSRIAGVCTAYKTRVDRLDNWFYAFRCLVDSDFRKKYIAELLLARTCEKLDDMSVDGALDDCIGVLVVVENPAVQKHQNQAIWPTTKMVYVGKNSAGFPMRVRYFAGARI